MMKKEISFFIVYLVILNIPLSSANNWSMPRCDHRNTNNSCSTIPRTPLISWISRLDIHSNESLTYISPLIYSNNKIFVIISYDNQMRDNGIYAIDEKSGDIVWENRTSATLLSINLGKIYLDNGEILYENNGTKASSGIPKCYGSFPIIYDNITFINAINYLYVKQANDCFVWTDNLCIDTWQGFSPGINSEKGFVLMAYYEDLYPPHLGYKNYLYAFEWETGNILWNYSSGSHFYSAPIVSNGLVYVNDGYLKALDEDSGELLWSYPIDERTLPAVSKEIVVITNDNEIIAYNSKNGSKNWRFQNKSNWDIQYTSPIIIDGKVIIANNRGEIIILNNRTGNVIWNYNINSTISISPIAVNGSIFLISNNGTLYAFGNSDKNIRVNDNVNKSLPYICLGIAVIVILIGLIFSRKFK